MDAANPPRPAPTMITSSLTLATIVDRYLDWFEGRVMVVIGAFEMWFGRVVWLLVSSGKLFAKTLLKARVWIFIDLCRSNLESIFRAQGEIQR